MNSETLKSLQRTAEKLRSDILRNDYDIRSILTFILTFIDEELKYEIDRNKTSQIYQ